MRQVPTASERALWQRINRCQLGPQIRRQVPWGCCYILDFFASSMGLVVEW